MLTKEQEIKTLSAFVGSLPLDSYLASIFAEISLPIISAIQCDLGFIGIRDIESAHREARTELADLQAKLHSMNGEIARKKKELDQHRDALTTARRMAESILRAC